MFIDKCFESNRLKDGDDMVQEIIKQVKDAEEKASHIVMEAQKNSVHLIDEAKKQAQQIKKKSEVAAQEEGNRIFDDKRREFEENEDIISKEMEKEINAIKSLVKENKEKALENVLQNFY